MNVPLSLCIIDDSFPVESVSWIDGSRPVCESSLRYLLEYEDWDEDEIKSLTTSVIRHPEQWSTVAFLGPDMFMKAREDLGYNPEIVVYDWDYNTQSQDSATQLAQIADSCHALIGIYSRSDHDEAIAEALELKEIAAYKDRIFSLHKETENSDAVLLKMFATHYETNFSGRLSRHFRSAVRDSVESVLVNLGRYSIDDVLASLASEGRVELLADAAAEKLAEELGNSGTDARPLPLAAAGIQDCIDSLLGKIRSMFSVGSPLDGLAVGGRAPASAEAVIGFWQYRLYHHPIDDLVRRGDIVEIGDHCFLVVTQSCDLARFWSKTYGHVNVVPLFACTRDGQNIRSRGAIVKTAKNMENAANNPASSLTSTGDGWYQGVFTLPSVEREGSTDVLLGFPKEITSICVPVPETLAGDEQKKTLAGTRLKYSDWPDAKRVCSLSEPFCSSLVQRCIHELLGHGVPNHPKAVQDYPMRATPATQEVRGQRSEVRNFSGALIITPSIRPICTHWAVSSACSASVI